MPGLLLAAARRVDALIDCATLHRDKDGRIVPCPGYSHPKVACCADTPGAPACQGPCPKTMPHELPRVGYDAAASMCEDLERWQAFERRVARFTTWFVYAAAAGSLTLLYRACREAGWAP